ncbi:hypothetical protein V5N11_029683 [Cardamine amara subsp. amara]|uniref:Uncharacterized protein n=1 Tax=Cardamine amara subsp. amara TaxID=228776 RepID=A0ABD1APB9_CARAN
MKGNKKNRSIFDKCDVSASQEIYLQRCGFAEPGKPPPDSDPAVVIASHRDSEMDSVIDSGYNDNAVESQAIRFVSPEESAGTVDSEDDVADPMVEVLAEKEKEKDVPVESNVDEDGGKKLKIPLKDVVKAIVMNSKNTEEEDKKIENMSCVQILLKKGFKF